MCFFSMIRINKEGDKHMKELDGWAHIGYNGPSHIYAKGRLRRLIDPKTNQILFEYWVPIGQRYSAKKEQDTSLEIGDKQK